MNSDLPSYDASELPAVDMLRSAAPIPDICVLHRPSRTECAEASGFDPVKAPGGLHVHLSSKRLETRKNPEADLCKLRLPSGCGSQTKGNARIGKTAIAPKVTTRTARGKRKPNMPITRKCIQDKTTKHTRQARSRWNELKNGTRARSVASKRILTGKGVCQTTPKTRARISPKNSPSTGKSVREGAAKRVRQRRCDKLPKQSHKDTPRRAASDARRTPTKLSNLPKKDSETCDSKCKQRTPAKRTSPAVGTVSKRVAKKARTHNSLQPSQDDADSSTIVGTCCNIGGQNSAAMAVTESHIGGNAALTATQHVAKHDSSVPKRQVATATNYVLGCLPAQDAASSCAMRTGICEIQPSNHVTSAANAEKQARRIAVGEMPEKATLPVSTGPQHAQSAASLCVASADGRNVSGCQPIANPLDNDASCLVRSHATSEQSTSAVVGLSMSHGCVAENATSSRSPKSHNMKEQQTRSSAVRTRHFSNERIISNIACSSTLSPKCPLGDPRSPKPQIPRSPCAYREWRHYRESFDAFVQSGDALGLARLADAVSILSHTSPEFHPEFLSHNLPAGSIAWRQDMFSRALLVAVEQSIPLRGIEMLLQCGGKVSITEALREASRRGKGDVVCALLKGSSICWRDASEALQTACRRGNMFLVQWIAANVQRQTRPKGFLESGILVAWKYGHLSVVDTLISAGANINEIWDERLQIVGPFCICCDGLTSLCKAAWRCCIDDPDSFPYCGVEWRLVDPLRVDTFFTLWRKGLWENWDLTIAQYILRKGAVSVRDETPEKILAQVAMLTKERPNYMAGFTSNEIIQHRLEGVVDRSEEAEVDEEIILERKILKKAKRKSQKKIV